MVLSNCDLPEEVQKLVKAEKVSYMYEINDKVNEITNFITQVILDTRVFLFRIRKFLVMASAYVFSNFSRKS